MGLFSKIKNFFSPSQPAPVSVAPPIQNTINTSTKAGPVGILFDVVDTGFEYFDKGFDVYANFMERRNAIDILEAETEAKKRQVIEVELNKNPSLINELKSDPEKLFFVGAVGVLVLAIVINR